MFLQPNLSSHCPNCRIPWIANEEIDLSTNKDDPINGRPQENTVEEKDKMGKPQVMHKEAPQSQVPLDVEEGKSDP